MSTTFSVPVADRLRAKPLDQNGNWSSEWMRFWPQFNGPTMVTMSLAKLTPAGTEGSISFNSFGFVTEIVPST